MERGGSGCGVAAGAARPNPGEGPAVAARAVVALAVVPVQIAAVAAAAPIPPRRDRSHGASLCRRYRSVTLLERDQVLSPWWSRRHGGRPTAGGPRRCRGSSAGRHTPLLRLAGVGAGGNSSGENGNSSGEERYGCWSSPTRARRGGGPVARRLARCGQAGAWTHRSRAVNLHRWRHGRSGAVRCARSAGSDRAERAAIRPTQARICLWPASGRVVGGARRLTGRRGRVAARGGRSARAGRERPR